MWIAALDSSCVLRSLITPTQIHKHRHLLYTFIDYIYPVLQADSRGSPEDRSRPNPL